MLLGYIELYSWLRIVLCLSETYSGNDFRHTYAIDPTTGDEVDIAIYFDLSVSEIREAYNYGRYGTFIMSDAVSDTLDVAQELEFRRASDRAIKRAVDNAFANSGVEEGETLNDEQVRRLAKDMAEGLTPFITHSMIRRQ